MLVIVPPQVYIERIFSGVDFNSYWQFYPSIFDGIPYPEGNTSWHHLWFILYLFLYAVLSVPLMKYMRGAQGKWLVAKIGALLKGKLHYLIMVPSLLVFVFPCAYFPQTNALVNDLAYFFYWFTFFWAGFIIASDIKIGEAIEHYRSRSLGWAILLLVVVNYLRWNKIEVNHNMGLVYFNRLITSAFGWMMLLAIMGYGKHLLNRPHKYLGYINQAIYPFYILHQTIIIIIGYYVIQVDESIMSKSLFVLVTTFIFSMAIFHYLIRPYKWVRIMFGVKPEIVLQDKKESVLNHRSLAYEEV